MNNGNENETENEKKDHKDTTYTDLGLEIPKYTKYKMCLSVMMIICIKQHLSNNWSSIHEYFKQHWSWVEQKRCL